MYNFKLAFAKTYTPNRSNFRELPITVAANSVEYCLESQDIQYSFKMTLAPLCFAFACLNTRAPFGVAAVAWRGARRKVNSREKKLLSSTLSHDCTVPGLLVAENKGEG